MPLPVPPPEECANCGAAIPRLAKACPECGADERTGWRETSLYDGLNLPDEVFDDENSADHARRQATTPRVNGVPWYWWAVGVVLLVLLVGALVGVM